MLNTDFIFLPGRDAEHSPHLVPRSRMSSYNSSPSWLLHGGSGPALLCRRYWGYTDLHTVVALSSKGGEKVIIKLCFPLFVGKKQFGINGI